MFRKGKQAEYYADPSEDNGYCVYRNLLQEGHRQCGVEVYDILTGPIRHPVIELVDDHSRTLPLSKPGVPEEGGICKYVKSSVLEYCAFCKNAETRQRERELNAKARKRNEEVDFLMKNIHRIRGVPEMEDGDDGAKVNSTVGPRGYVQNRTVEHQLIYCPPAFGEREVCPPEGIHCMACAHCHSCDKSERNAENYCPRHSMQ